MDRGQDEAGFDLGPRWTEGPQPGEGRPREAEAIELFRSATSLPAFSAVSAQRVWRRLGAAPARRRWLRPAVVLGLALAASAATAASVAVIRKLSKPVAPRLAPATAPAPARRSLATPAPAPTTVAAPLVIRAADVPAVKGKTRAKTVTKPKVDKIKHPARLAPAVAAVEPAAPGPVAHDEGTLAEETALFRQALSLRAARDARGALGVLDRYAARYPRGSYAAEVLVLRGELASDAGDCAGATASFTRALAAPGSPGLEERALYGRAACRLRSGYRAAAQSDLTRYLERFPHGRFADFARASLK